LRPNPSVFRCFVFVTALLLLIALAAIGVQSTTPMTKNPLRLVVSRSPRYEVLYRNPEQEKLVGWWDTLECGHQVELWNFGIAEPSFGPEAGTKRHRCAECGAAIARVEAAPKKPSQSVTPEEIRRRMRSA
jgi:hypothetical protein